LCHSLVRSEEEATGKEATGNRQTGTGYVYSLFIFILQYNYS